MTGRASTAGFGRLSNRRKTDMRVLARLPAAALLLLSSVFAVAFLMAARAFGQDVDPIVDTTVALPETLIGFAIQIAFLVISGVLAVFLPIVLTKLATKYGLQIEQEKRDSLQVTLTNAAGGLLQKIGDHARAARIDVGDPAMKAAIDRVLAGAPDAVKWAGLSEAEIARRILEKIPQIENTSGAAPMSTPPVGP
jgi:hypothetical protein